MESHSSSDKNEADEKENYFDWLPNEAIVEIFPNIELKDLVALRQTAKRFKVLIDNYLERPEHVIHIMNISPAITAGKFLDYYCQSEAYNILKNKKTSEMQPTELICFALAANDKELIEINPEQLHEAIEAMDTLLSLELKENLNLTLLRIRAGLSAETFNSKEKKKFIDKLQDRGVETINDKYLNLAGADLSTADLDDKDLTGANLNGANLARAQLNGSTLKGAHLVDANLAMASLERADLTGADLNSARLDAANLAAATLIKANLSEAELGSAGINGSNFTDADLSGSNLDRVSAIGANLTGADLSDSTMRNANFTDADLSGSNLERITTGETDLTGANLRDVNIIVEDLPQVILHGATFSYRDSSQKTREDFSLFQPTGGKTKNKVELGKRKRGDDFELEDEQNKVSKKKP